MEIDETSLGNYVEIVAPDFDDNFGKSGFIAAIVEKTARMGSIYSFEGDQIIILGDYSGSELKILGKKISKDDLISRINTKKTTEVMIKEMQRLLKLLYNTSS